MFSETISGNLRIGDWVVIMYDGLTYPGEVKSMLHPIGVEVTCMHPTSSGDKYKWPDKSDNHIYPYSDIKKKIRPPVPFNSRASLFTFEDSLQ